MSLAGSQRPRGTTQDPCPGLGMARRLLSSSSARDKSPDRPRATWAIEGPRRAKSRPSHAALGRALASGLWGVVYGDPKTQKCRTCFQGGPRCPKWLACHCPLPVTTAQHTPGPGGRGRGPRENSAQCQLQSASRSRLPWQREGGGGGAESLWKVGMCVLLPWSQIFPLCQTHATSQAGKGARPCCPGGPHPRALAP